MGILSRNFRQPSPHGNEHRETAAHLPGPGTFSVEVVGESNYQTALESICGGRTQDGVNEHVTATLVCEDSNRWDSLAVRVDVGGMTVGYLDRLNARRYRKQLEKAGHPRITATCAARIRGGWDRGNQDTGHFGVRIDLPTRD